MTAASIIVRTVEKENIDFTQSPTSLVHPSNCSFIHAMASCGCAGVSLILIASRSGGVVLERWAHRESAVRLLSPTSPLARCTPSSDGASTVVKQRAEVLSWLHSTAMRMIHEDGVADENERVMRRNGVPIIFSPVGPELVFYYVGSDDVDEMQCTKSDILHVPRNVRDQLISRFSRSSHMRRPSLLNERFVLLVIWC